LRTTATYGVRGFPTTLVKYGEKEVLLRGYQSFETVKSVISSLTEGTLKEKSTLKSEEALLAFIVANKRVAPVEIITAFDYSAAEWQTIMVNLIERSLIKVAPAGNGVLIEAAGDPLSCDPVTGLCGF
jgi:helix-turn-helix protein